jgi:hypothetical protein
MAWAPAKEGPPTIAEAPARVGASDSRDASSMDARRGRENRKANISKNSANRDGEDAFKSMDASNRRDAATLGTTICRVRAQGRIQQQKGRLKECLPSSCRDAFNSRDVRNSIHSSTSRYARNSSDDNNSRTQATIFPQAPVSIPATAVMPATVGLLHSPICGCCSMVGISLTNLLLLPYIGAIF